MDRFDAKPDVRHECPQRNEGRIQAAFLQDRGSSVVDDHPIRGCRESSCRLIAA